MQNNSSKFLKYISLSCLIFFANQVSAQFTITDNFKGSTSPGIIIGDNAKLTSGQEDPVNAGWLRLTRDTTHQKGYAYINKSFPSTLGVLVDFEYTMWRSIAENYNGADGLSVFLFDAKYGPYPIPNNFALGAFGSGLGYANLDNDPGLKGGYLGIGFDAFGNFASDSEGKSGGSSGSKNGNYGGLSPNSFIFRGPTTDNVSSPTNPYLKGVTLLEDGSIVDALEMRGNSRHDLVDYNTITPTRPSYELFYRRVEIIIMPTGTGFYDIKISWTKEFGGELVELMTYRTAHEPPALLKIGFAASTGGGINHHEVRNLLITTPGDLRVVKRANVDLLRSIARPQEEVTGPSNEIEYRIDVSNDTPAAIDAIDFTDKLTDANAAPIPKGLFEITSITPIGFVTSGTSLPNPSIANPILSGEFDGILHLAANSVGTIMVKGILKHMPIGNILTNTTSVFPTTIIDEDLLNNTSVVQTPVVSEKSDLVVTSSVDESCLIPGESNEKKFSVVVSNIGILPLEYSGVSGITPIELSLNFPAELILSYPSSLIWSRVGQTNVFRYIPSGTLRSGQSLPVFEYMLKSDTGYTTEVSVSCKTEAPENTHNNKTNNSVNPVPAPPTLVNQGDIYYCLGAKASPLEAIATGDNKLIWYLNPGGAPSAVPFTPNTSFSGTTTYYVLQQAEGGCASDLTPIRVVVLPKVHSGIIGPENQEICSNRIPSALYSPAKPRDNANTNIRYRWEKSEDAGVTWTSIPDAHESFYQPGALKKTTSFRRYVLVGVSCESIASNLVTIKIKNCVVITNPMINQKTRAKTDD